MMITKGAKAALTKIQREFHPSPEGQLMFGIIAQCVKDLYGGGSFRATMEDIKTARETLSGEMRPALLAGVDPERVRDILRKGGVYLGNGRNKIASQIERGGL